MREDDCAVLLEQRITGNVVDVVVSVDDKFYGEPRELADFGEHLFCGFGVLEGVDDGYAVVTDDEAGVSACVAFGVVDGGVDFVAERSEQEGGRR